MARRAGVLACAALLGVLAAMPAAAQPGYIVSRDGAITHIRLGNREVISEAMVVAVRPGWSDDLFRQGSDGEIGRPAAAAPLRLESMLGAGDGRAKVSQVITATPTGFRVAYTVTPLRDLDVETLMLRLNLPAAGNAGATRYALVDAGSDHGILPAAPTGEQHVILGSRPVELIYLETGGETGLRMRLTGLQAQLQDNRRWKDPTFSFLLTARGGRLRAGEAIRFAWSVEEAPSATLKAEMAAASGRSFADLPMRDGRPLALQAVTASRTRCRAYETIELDCRVAVTYSNPFDPTDVAVDCWVVGPHGRRLTVPGFYSVPARLTSRGASERVTPAGAPSFRVRFSPPEPGRYTLTVVVRDGAAVVRGRPITLTAGPAASSGHVRVAGKRHFQTDDGRSFVPVGENMCWANANNPVATYRAWLKGLGAAGGNWVRLWLSNNEKGTEWTPAPTAKAGIGSYRGLGQYAMDNAWRLDQVVALAEATGVRLMFCLGTYGEFTDGGYFGEGSWVSNPYNARNGGPCGKPEDFWTNADARRLYKQRLRYLVARYSHSTALFAWEFWNEVPPTPSQSKWVDEMARYLKQVDPNRHMVSTTYGDAATWRSPAIDFTMKHMYGQAGNTPDFTPGIQRDTQEAELHDKPYLLAEFGIDWQTADSRWDPSGTGVSMHNGAWAALMSGAAGTAMLWYWDGYVHPKDLYHILTPVRRFADRIDWPHAGMEPVRSVAVRQESPSQERFSDLVLPGSVEWGMPPNTVYEVGRDGSISGGPMGMAIGSPQRGKPSELPTRLTWKVDMPADGTITLMLGQVCTAANMVISLDGKPVVTRELRAGPEGAGPWKRSKLLEQYNCYVVDYDEPIAIDVPAGRHVITASNTAGDWYQIRSVTIPAYRSSRYPDINALALAGPRTIVAWVHNRQSSWRTDYDGKRPETLGGLVVTVPAADAAWRVEWFDTWTGKPLSRTTIPVTGAKLELRCPPLRRDLAAICTRVGDPGTAGKLPTIRRRKAER
ncbi:MAG: DUF5060 domain-containing protein [Armatimonadetes bacterium]|nr:DUF5060 domain-containing protein [Armatimonadota bacterium]